MRALGWLVLVGALSACTTTVGANGADVGKSCTIDEQPFPCDEQCIHSSSGTLGFCTMYCNDDRDCVYSGTSCIDAKASGMHLCAVNCKSNQDCNGIGAGLGFSCVSRGHLCAPGSSGCADTVQVCYVAEGQSF